MIKPGVTLLPLGFCSYLAFTPPTHLIIARNGYLVYHYMCPKVNVWWEIGNKTQLIHAERHILNKLNLLVDLEIRNRLTVPLQSGKILPIWNPKWVCGRE